MKSDKKKQDVIREKKKERMCNPMLGAAYVAMSMSCLFHRVFIPFFRKQEGLAPLLNFIQKVKHKYKRGETQKVGN